MSNHVKTDWCVSMANRVLMQKLKKDGNSNFVSSPLSLHLMLSFVAAGTKGEALEKLLALFGSESISQLNDIASHVISLISQQREDLSDEEELEQDSKRARLGSELMIRRGKESQGPELCFANGMWIDQSCYFKPGFKEVAKVVYKARAKRVDFLNKADNARRKVNQWVEKETKGLIKEILPPNCVKTDTGLILANALYFKGSWLHKFDKWSTKHESFHLIDGQVVQVPFMNGKTNGLDYHHKQFDGYKVLKLPYQGGRRRQFAMYFFLPDALDGLPSLMESLNSQAGFFSQEFDLDYNPIDAYWIPKFKFSSEFEASETIQKTGKLEMLFRPGGDHLSEMIGSSRGKPWLSKVFHKCHIEVNEEGTKAGASSVALIRQLCYFEKAETFRFVADHSFLFMIREEHTRSVLFFGTLLNPLL